MFQINWKLKVLLYKVFNTFQIKGFFYLIQKYITKRSIVKITEINKLWTYHADSIERENVKSLLEVGAGKSLEQNIYFAYRFDNSIKQTTIDINLMIDLDLVNQASKQISNLLGLKNKGKIKKISDLKDFYNINYKAPCPLENLINTDDKFDICISTTALEHFTVDDIKKYLSDLKNVLNKNILVSSIIDYSDHYSHTDKNIGALNFLNYSEKEWKKFNNPYLFQNRLRHQDYKRIFEDCGYSIKKVFKGPPSRTVEKISEEFDAKNNETFVTWAYFLIRLK
jgi:hypothetical protein